MQQNCYTWTRKSKLVKDVITGVCHQSYENVLNRSDPNVNAHAAVEENLEEELKLNK